MKKIKILICGSKGRYSDGIDIAVLDVSDNKEFLAEKLEREVYKIISRSSEKYAAQAYKGFEEKGRAAHIVTFKLTMMNI